MAKLRRALRVAARPFEAFFAHPAASGIVLLAATLVALAWANSPIAHVHRRLFGPALHVIDDGLMAIFFFLVGMEIKRELAIGELRTPQRAMLPAFAALGGMIVPASIYALVNRGGSGARGWGIPMATDIAFALGCITAVKGRVPASLSVFLTALAIFDDLGAIVVIAVFYGQTVHLSWLGGAFVCAVVLFSANTKRPLFYVLGGALLWFLVFRSGVHATIAGVVAGLAVPARGDDAPLERMARALHAPVSYGIVPLFALANAGVAFAGSAELGSPVAIGVAVGLLLGKPIGVFAFTTLAVKLRLGTMPEGANQRQLLGVAILAGIGFTMSVFISGLAFGESALAEAAKLGILVGSALSAMLGVMLLRA